MLIQKKKIFQICCCCFLQCSKPGSVFVSAEVWAAWGWKIKRKQRWLLTGGWEILRQCELDEFLKVAICGAGEGESKADFNMLNKSNMPRYRHTPACVWIVHAHNNFMIMYYSATESLCSSYLYCFSEDSKNWSNRDKVPAAVSKLFGCFQRSRKRRERWRQRARERERDRQTECFRLNPVSPWTLQT